MDLVEVQRRVEEIYAAPDTDMRNRDDKLRTDVLVSIANGVPNAAELAAAALATDALGACRWRA